MSKITYIDEVEIKNKKALLRVDYNVSLKNNGREILDDQRIIQSLPTLRHLLKNKNKIILMSHLGRPDGAPDPKYSLQIVCDRLSEYLSDFKIRLIKDFKTEPATTFKFQQTDEILVLENIRFYKGEKENSEVFAKELAGLADIFVNDAFGVCHRSDASGCGVAKYLPSYGGILLKKEVSILKEILARPQKPLMAIIGGSKIDTKIALLNKLLSISDFLFVGGALANTMLYAKGIDVKLSLFEKDKSVLAKRILEKAHNLGKEILLPIDYICGQKDTDTMSVECEGNNIQDGTAVLDIGTKTIKLIDDCIKKSKTVVWNGPVGYFENKNYQAGTDAIYKSLTESKELVSILGGGDTISAIAKHKNKSKITHISTGGGAMLEFLEKGTLPGIEALKN